MANCKDISNGIILTITYNFSDQLSYIFFHMMIVYRKKNSNRIYKSFIYFEGDDGISVFKVIFHGI